MFFSSVLALRFAVGYNMTNKELFSPKIDSSPCFFITFMFRLSFNYRSRRFCVFFPCHRSLSSVSFFTLILLFPFFFASNPAQCASPSVDIKFRTVDSGNVSLNIYNSDGRVVRELLHGRPLEIGDHVIHWDGKDYHGSPLPSGEYLWRALVAQSFRSEYQMTLGVTSSPGWRRWPGAYGGIRAICCDKDALYFGAYGPSTILMVKQNDSGERDWEITSSFEPWQGPISLARSADKLYMFQPNGMIYRIDADTSERLGRFDASWNAHVRYVRPFLDKLTADYDDNERQPAISSMAQPKDMACAGSLLAVSYYTHNAIRWYRPETGKLLGQTLIEAPVAIAFDGSGELLVVSKESVYRVKPGEKEPEMLIKEAPGAYRIQVDPVSGDLLIVEERHNIDGQKKTLIARYSSSGEFLRFYGLDQPKQYGPWNPLVFGDISSISCDYHGGFYISDALLAESLISIPAGGF
jgi:hypothetical protein